MGLWQPPESTDQLTPCSQLTLQKQIDLLCCSPIQQSWPGKEVLAPLGISRWLGSQPPWKGHCFSHCNLWGRSNIQRNLPRQIYCFDTAIPLAAKAKRLLGFNNTSVLVHVFFLNEGVGCQSLAPINSRFRIQEDISLLHCFFCRSCWNWSHRIFGSWIFMCLLKGMSFLHRGCTQKNMNMWSTVVQFFWNLMDRGDPPSHSQKSCLVVAHRVDRSKTNCIGCLGMWIWNRKESAKHATGLEHDLCHDRDSRGLAVARLPVWALEGILEMWCDLPPVLRSPHTQAPQEVSRIASVLYNR